MNESQAMQVSEYSGQYPVNLDGRWRLRIPVAFQQSLLQDSQGKALFVMPTGGGLCLISMHDLPLIYEELRKPGLRDRKTETVKRCFAHGVSVAVLADGRFTVPRRVRRLCGLEAKTILVMVGTRLWVEVWQQNRWQANN